VNPSHDDMYMQNVSLLDYYHSTLMNKVRRDLLTDVRIEKCAPCHYEDSFDKPSGRAKQLLRSDIQITNFNEDYLNSKHRALFEDNNGAVETNIHLVDLQINLSNTCNSACIMCLPQFSSRLNQDYKKLSKTIPLFWDMPDFKCWADDPILVKKFMADLIELPSIEYIHLLGGETLYLKSFYSICESLIEHGLSNKISIGTTTNLTILPLRIEHLVDDFKSFHIGLSIESVTSLNNYIRYPSDISDVLGVLSSFLSLREAHPNLHLSLRITPNIFSIFYIDELIQYMCDHNITAESCNILNFPSCLRMEFIPEHLKDQTILKIKRVIEKNDLTRIKVVDARNPSKVRQVISSVAHSYLDFLEDMELPSDSDKHRYDLVTFLNGFESLRGNSILDHAPEYKEFLTSYGYQK